MNDVSEEGGSRLETAAWYAVVAMAFLSPFSLPAARASIAVAAVLTLAGAVTGRIRIRMPAAGWLALAWIVLAVIVTVFGANPKDAVPRLPKLIWFMSIPFVATLVSTPRRLRVLVTAFVLGGAALAAHLLVRNPIVAARKFAAGDFTSFTQALISGGSMTDGQRLVVTLAGTALLAMVFRGRGRVQFGWLAALALQVAAFVVNFKRGSWAVAGVMMSILAGAKWRWKAAILFAGMAVLLVAVPPVRHRLGQLREEFNPDGGGRLTMWTRVAPALIGEHPFGIGVRALTSEAMVAIAPNVEKDRDHLHSNLAQILVETGWLGFALYLAWMFASLRDAWRLAGGRSGWPPGVDADRWLPLIALVGLMLNGLVEYNMGDAEIVLLYGLFMGAAAAGSRWKREGVTGDATPALERAEGAAPR